MLQKTHTTARNGIEKKEDRHLREKSPTKYFKDIDLADRYSVSRMTIWRWAKAGIIPSPEKIGPNTTRWNGDVIAAHDAQQNVDGY